MRNEGILFIIKFLAIVLIITIVVYSQRYTTKDNIVADKGIWFTTTINLNEYKLLGHGKGLFGNYSVYSRSDRHEAISVYKENK